jgi:GNAT superfamily N-acetyltransferase
MSHATIIKMPARPTPTRAQRRKIGHELTPPTREVSTESGRKLRLVTRVDKDAAGMATEYSVRLAPGEIARIKLQRLAHDQSWIDWVYVPPAWRDCGLGGQLLRHVLRDADAFGVRLTLEARACGDTDQAALERWYERMGFQRTGKRGQFGPIFARAAVRSRAA